MADDNSKNVENIDDLDAFSKEYFQIEDTPDEVDEVEDTDEDDAEIEGHEDEDDALATDDEDDDEDDEKAHPSPKQKRKPSFQERINELTAKAREAERREAALIKRLEELETGREDKKDEQPPLREVLPDGAPDPDAVDDKGNPLYPLGEFDPKYITALVKYTNEQERAAAKEQEARENQAKAIEMAQSELVENWNTQLEEAEKEIPEIRENISHLTEAFEDINPAYGEYLAMTIMGSEVGHLVMNYLSQNIGEAKQIVAAGPAAATLALGRLEAQFMKNSTKGEKRNNKVSDAPEPPESRTRGHGGRFTVSPDTDDLDAFERVYFNKK